ncbi:DUF3597 domain-containing protein [Beijerinckia indica]|uniref:DUF3597 domain-containing protein n=1 Tax=Beijerinckia indica subsp. indica (strain ATCC 9039 / DSM 1715 / NCIMB 8712) TaxID=395963 RepID=B2IG10_BEII9|nr:DUF3597 domain-containing protein [Beijerinckia indica]ACB95749.1 conserved hypothetical protein [Beijerinckia indica subsp. indica ATCC 9039]
MSFFGSIMSKIFGTQEAKAETTGTEPAAPTPEAPAAGAPAGGTTVDVAAVLDKLLQDKQERLDWKHSIVDLLKLLDLDSSLTARKELADELHYEGDKSDSASMNIWLHKEVMKKLAANGGRVPDDLKAA